MGTWTNTGGARLRLKADRTMSAAGVHRAVRSGASCADTATGRWAFYAAPVGKGPAAVDNRLTRGDRIGLADAAAQPPCRLSALVGRDARGLHLCLVQGPDADRSDHSGHFDCSVAQLLRPEADARRSPAPQSSSATPPSGSDTDEGGDTAGTDDGSDDSDSVSKVRKSRKSSGSTRKTRH